MNVAIMISPTAVASSCSDHDHDDGLCESADGIVYSPTSMKDRARDALCSRPPSPDDRGTVVTSDCNDDDDEDEDEDEDEEFFENADYCDRFLDYDEGDDSEQQLSIDDDVPAEVKVSHHCEGNDNDGSSSSDRDSDSESELEEEESDDEAAEDADESEEDYRVEEEDDSAGQYETNDDSSVDSKRSGDDGSIAGGSCFSANNGIPNGEGDDCEQRHDLFLPWDALPSVESLKYEEEEESSDDDDDDDDDDCGDALRYCHSRSRSYMVSRGGRPRMWDGCPSGVSISSDSSSSSEDGSRCSHQSKKRKEPTASKAGGVSFSENVTVHPIYDTKAYPASIIKSIYTKREELRVNKLRNKKEFAHDMHDWRHVTEEEDMEADGDTGELVHPVHRAAAAKAKAPCRTRNVVQTYSSALGGYHGSSGASVVHRAKRMRMYYP